MRPGGAPAGDGRALWGARAPRTRCSCRSPSIATAMLFNALIGTGYPGIVDLRSLERLQPLRPPTSGKRVGRTSSVTSANTADGLGEQKTFGEQGVPLVKQVFAAWRGYQHDHHDRARLQAEIAPVPDRTPATARDRQRRRKGAQSLAPRVREQPAEDLARALDVHPCRRRRADEQSRRTRAPRTRDPPQNLARNPKQQRRAIR